MELPKRLAPETQGDDIAVAITVQTQLSSSRTIIMQTYVPRDADPKVFHDTLDKLGGAIDRQDAKYSIKDLQANLEVHEKTLKQLEEDYTRIDGKAQAEWEKRGKKGPVQLNQNESAQKGTMEQNVKRYRQEIEKIKVAIKEQEAILAKVD